MHLFGGFVLELAAVDALIVVMGGVVVNKFVALTTRKGGHKKRYSREKNSRLYEVLLTMCQTIPKGRFGTPNNPFFWPS